MCSLEDDTILLSISSIRQAMESISLYELATHLEQDIEEINSNVSKIIIKSIVDKTQGNKICHCIYKPVQIFGIIKR